MQVSPSLWHKFVSDKEADLNKLKEFHAVLHEMHDSVLELIIRGCYVRQMYTETQEELGPIHREKVIQEL